MTIRTLLRVVAFAGLATSRRLPRAQTRHRRRPVNLMQNFSCRR
jgi:hypothetical protein